MTGQDTPSNTRRIEIRTIPPRIGPQEAVARAGRITMEQYVRTRIGTLLGREHTPDVYRAYYPDYLAYTTVMLRRYLAGDREVRFLAGIDGVTGRVGEIDASLPERRVEGVDPATVLEPDLDEGDAEAAWREWLWKYLDRKYRPVRRPETTLDDLELFYVPYWIVDHGSKGRSIAVSALTKDADRIEDIEALATYYDDALS